MELEDDELILLICQKNEEALDMLLFRYQKHCISLISNYFYKMKYSGVSFEELRAQLNLTILKAVETYDPRRSIFYSYWRQIAERELINQQRKSFFKKNRITSSGYSLDSQIKDTEDCCFVDTIADENENIVEAYNQKEKLHRISDVIKDALSLTEKTILAYRVEGYSYKEIAQIMNKTSKDVDNALMLMRKKLPKNYEG